MKMTLSEYLDQGDDPYFHPTVNLREGEYSIGPYYGVTGALRASVYIQGIPFEYVSVQGRQVLYTSDEDGNPKRMSVFHLPEYLSHTGELVGIEPDLKEQTI